jgi:hypothetical protein
VLDVFRVARDGVVHTDHHMALLDQSVLEVRSQESGPTGDEHSGYVIGHGKMGGSRARNFRLRHRLGLPVFENSLQVACSHNCSFLQDHIRDYSQDGSSVSSILDLNERPDSGDFWQKRDPIRSLTKIGRPTTLPRSVLGCFSN